MSKHTKINFLNPSDLNDIKSNKNDTPSKKDTNEKYFDTTSGKKDTIKIEKIKIVKKDLDKNNNSDIDIDISAEKDKSNNKIIWEYNISDENIKKIKQKNLENKKEELK